MYWNESFWRSEFYFLLYFGWNYFSDLTQIPEELPLLRNWIFGCINWFLWEKIFTKYATFQYFIRISYMWVEGTGGACCSWEKGIPYQRIKRDYLSPTLFPVSDLVQSCIFPLASKAPGSAQFLGFGQDTQTNRPNVWCIKDTEWIQALPKAQNQEHFKLLHFSAPVQLCMYNLFKIWLGRVAACNQHIVFVKVPPYCPLDRF